MRNRFGAEERILTKVDTDKAFEKAQETLGSWRIDERDFEDLYGEQVERDLREVERLEAIFAKDETRESRETKRLSDILEAIIMEESELSNWFGEGVSTIKTSKFDDYINGIDVVVEFPEKETGGASFLGLATDVTFRTDASTKLDGIIKHIKEGHLGKIKYFSSEHLNMRGELSRLPEVVIGVSRRTIAELEEAWLSKDHGELAQHRVQFMILRQIKAQLEAFSQLAESLDKPELVKIFKERLGIIDRILRSKAKMESKNPRDLFEDQVHADIMFSIERRLKTIDTE